MDFKSTLHFNEFPPISTEEWESVIEQDLKGKNYKEVLRWKSPEGVEVLPFYRREDLKNLQHAPNPVLESSGWHVLEYIQTEDVKEANRQALEALENGAAGLFFDLDSRAVSSKQALEELLKDIRLDIITLKLSSSLSTPTLATWLAQLCEQRYEGMQSADIFFDFDPLGQALYSGVLPDKDHIKSTIETFAAGAAFPAVNASAYANAGATITQQLAFALSAANEYLGMNANYARTMHFNFAVGPAYFPEIAKFRAFRLLWNRVLEEYGQKKASMQLHGETALWNKSQTDAHNNMLRTTTEAMSAALGGCDAITVHRYDEHFAPPSGFAQRIARNTQLLLQEEAYLDKVADPGAGSYYIETLTDDMAEESWTLFQEIEGKGGFYACLKSGFIQDEIIKSREHRIQAYREKNEALVGVNKYQPDEVIEDLTLQMKDYSGTEWDNNHTIEIKKIEPLNIEAELQKGDA